MFALALILPLIFDLIQCSKTKSGTQMNEKPLYHASANALSRSKAHRAFAVPRKRLELSRLAAYAPQAYLYTIPTPGHVILLNNS